MTPRAGPTGVVGLGNMGGVIAARLVSLGYGVVAYDVDRSARDKAARSGVATAESVTALADRCGTVLLSLPGPAALSATIDQVVGRRCRTIIDFSTVGPMAARAAEERLRAAGCAYVEAPLTGGPKEAQVGALRVLLVATAEACAATQPLLNSLATEVVYLGEDVGAAQTMKVLNNLVGATILAISCEALVAARKLGASPTAFAEFVGAGVSGSFIMRTMLPHIISRRFDYGFSLDLAAKDLGLAMDQLGAAGLELPLAEKVHELIGYAAQRLARGSDATSYATLLEDAAGVRVEEASVGGKRPSAEQRSV